ncbi:hypothetical protein N8I77_001059 [Diaporthe amygdali]|uniref:Uncharacterized protein n=1 Tax=Phomopsis amygdali TaxID=1214568 RepID=A0AAD9SNC4_PHOAM|nr:hypothetical protein N8I77_001059 [Diaporthe amygdali]
MKSIWITALTLAAGALGSAVIPQGPQVQVERRLHDYQSPVLANLLREIRSQTTGIDDTLDKFLGPIPNDTAKAVASVIGSHFENITTALRSAQAILRTLGKNVTLVDEDGRPCNSSCILDKTKGIVKDTGEAAKKSLLKLGLHTLGKFIAPTFLVLSGIIVALNTLVGGALAVVATLVNGMFLAIAGGIAYLGHLVSEKEKQMAGGPDGFLTKEVSKMIGEAVDSHFGL